MILYLDTTDFNKIIFGFSLSGKDKIYKQLLKIKPNESFKTVWKLEEFLKKNKISKQTIKKIVVNKGPGSFVGTRVGITISLALGFALGVKVKMLTKDEMEKVL